MTSDELAEKIVDDWYDGTIPLRLDLLKTSVAKALLSASTPPAGCVRDEKGVDRKVLGELCLSGDGCVITPTAFVYVMPPHCANPGGCGFSIVGMYRRGPQHTHSEPSWSDCYSTLAAAQAAALSAGSET